MNFVGVRGGKECGDISGEKGIAVRPGDEWGLRLEHHLWLSAGQRAFFMVKGDEGDIAQLLQNMRVMRCKSLRSNKKRFFHAGFACGGDEQEKTPEVVAVSDGDDSVAFHSCRAIWIAPFHPKVPNCSFTILRESTAPVTLLLEKQLS